MASLTKKIIDGRAYYYLRECKRVDGKPKIVWQQYLGTADALASKLVAPTPQSAVVREFGASMACFKLAEELKIVETIDRHCRKRTETGLSVGQYILISTLNRCIAPLSKKRISAWYQKTVLPRLLPVRTQQLTSQRFWDNMDRLDAEAITMVEDEISKTVVQQFGLDLRCLLFDATNFFTFIDSFNMRSKLAQRGKCKSGRTNLRILGLALLVTSDGEIPLFHHTYAGNQHDSVTFKSVSGQLIKRCEDLSNGVSDITLIFDKGNNSEENLDIVKDSTLHFVGSLVPTQHQDLLKISRDQMRRLDTKQLPKVWAYRTKKNVFGVNRTILVTFNRLLYEAQYKTFIREINKRKRKLQRLQLSLQHARVRKTGKKPTLQGTKNKVKMILNGRHMAGLFTARVLGKEGRLRLRWKFNTNSWKSLKRTLLGKTLLFTDHEDWTDEQIVLGYRSQHHVESAFRRMKDVRYLTFRPTFHWTDQKLRVHAFYCVMALTIVSLLRRKLNKAGMPMSISRMMEKLSGVQEIALLYPGTKKTNARTRTILSDIDKQQRCMLAALQITS
jgi:transposase